MELSARIDALSIELEQRHEELKRHITHTVEHAIVPLLQGARPTFFFGVPRVWEKMMDGIKAKAANNSPLKMAIAT